VPVAVSPFNFAMYMNKNTTRHTGFISAPLRNQLCMPNAFTFEDIAGWAPGAITRSDSTTSSAVFVTASKGCQFSPAGLAGAVVFINLFGAMQPASRNRRPTGICQNQMKTAGPENHLGRQYCRPNALMENKLQHCPTSSHLLWQALH